MLSTNTIAYYYVNQSRFVTMYVVAALFENISEMYADIYYIYWRNNTFETTKIVNL